MRRTLRVPNSRVPRALHEPPISIPENKLLHFDSPIRIPNAYLVAFKCEKALAVYTANTAHISRRCYRARCQRVKRTASRWHPHMPLASVYLDEPGHEPSR